MNLQKINLNNTTGGTLKEAVDILKNGGIIIYPTDTAYGIGCDASNFEAVEKIRVLKKRKEGLSWPVIAGSLEMAKGIFTLNESEKKLALKYWPRDLEDTGHEKGKLSLILRIKKHFEQKIANNVLASDKTIAVRVPNSVWARNISLYLGKPIISTSANVSGTLPCYSIREIKESFKMKADQIFPFDFVLDAGKLERVPPSTIVRLYNGKMELLREGIITSSDLMAVIC